MVYRSDPQGPPLLIVAFGGRIFGVRTACGEHVWQHEFAGVFPVRLAIHETRVYVLGRPLLTCLEYATGRLLWDVKVGYDPDTLLAEGDLVFVAGAGEVRCFRADGTLAWHDRFKGMGYGDVCMGLPGHVAQVDTRA